MESLKPILWVASTFLCLFHIPPSHFLGALWASLYIPWRTPNPFHVGPSTTKGVCPHVVGVIWQSFSVTWSTLLHLPGAWLDMRLCGEKGGLNEECGKTKQLLCLKTQKLVMMEWGRSLSAVTQQEMRVFGLCTLYLMSLAPFIMSLILLRTLGFRFSKISYIVVDTSCWHFYLHILSENQQPQLCFFLFCPYYPLSLRSWIQILLTKFVISMTPKIIWPSSGP